MPYKKGKSPMNWKNLEIIIYVNLLSIYLKKYVKVAISRYKLQDTYIIL